MCGWNDNGKLSRMQPAQHPLRKNQSDNPKIPKNQKTCFSTRQYCLEFRQLKKTRLISRKISFIYFLIIKKMSKIDVTKKLFQIF